MTFEPAPRSSRFMTLRRVLLGSALIGFLVRAVALLPAQESSEPRGYLGIHARSNSNVLDASNALEGITVTGVVENSPAEAAGVRVGDILLQAGGVDLTDPAQLLFLADSLPVGSGIHLRLERDRRVREIEVRTVARLEPSAGGRAGETRNWIENKLLGIEFGAVDPELAERLGLSSFEAIQIFRIARKSPLNDAGILAGSVIRQIDGEKIYSPQGLLDYLDSDQDARTVALRVGDGEGRWKNIRVQLRRPGRSLKKLNLPFIFGYSRESDKMSLYLPLYLFRLDRLGETARYRILWFLTFETGNPDELLDIEPY